MKRITLLLLTYIISGVLSSFMGYAYAEKAQKTTLSVPSRVGQSQTVNWDEIDLLDLKRAAGIALVNNPSLVAAEARVRQAKERFQQAMSRYWPSLDATLSEARVSFAENNPNPNPLGDDPENRYRAGLTAGWVLFDGFQRKFSKAAAQYGHRQSEASRNEANRLILSAVASAYFSAQLALEDITIAKTDEVFNQRQLADAEARYRIGTGALSNVLNFKIRVNQAKTGLINSEKVFEEALFGLAALLGAPGARFPSGMKLARLKPETPEEMEPPDAGRQVDYAMTHRPDIREGDYALKQAESQIKIAQGKFYPSINLAASVDGNRTEDAGFEPDDFGNTVGFNLTYNLFSGGLDRARLNEARARALELDKNLKNLKLQIHSEVRISSSRVKTTQRQLVLQRSNTDLNQQNRGLVEKEYAAGQVSLVRLNEAQRDLTTAQSRLALVLVSLRQAWFNLETDTGRILESLPD